MMNNDFCSITLQKLLYTDIAYYINYSKYENNISDQSCRYLFIIIELYEPDTIRIIMSGITDLPLQTNSLKK